MQRSKISLEKAQYSGSNSQFNGGAELSKFTRIKLVRLSKDSARELSSISGYTVRHHRGLGFRSGL